MENLLQQKYHCKTDHSLVWPDCTLVVFDSLDLCLVSFALARPRSTSELSVWLMKSDRGGVGGLSCPEIFPQLTDLLPSVNLLFLFLSVFKAPVSFLNRDIIHHFI